MDKRYFKTRFYAAYKAEIQRVFNSDELCRFVRDLRNYMTHRGLPESSMSLTAKPTGDAPTPNGIPVGLSSGVHYAKAPFLAWDGWTSPAKRYLDKIDDKVSLSDLFLPHIEKMQAFDRWFDEAFRQHHQQDYEELQKMTETYLKLKDEEDREKADNSSTRTGS